MQSLNINTAKIDKSALYKGTKGTYLNITLLENREGTDQYGNDGMIVQDIGKERREAGERGPILGNWKHIKQSQSAKPQAATQSQPEEDDSIPF
jgi:hypothetical protein